MRLFLWRLVPLLLLVLAPSGCKKQQPQLPAVRVTKLVLSDSSDPGADGSSPQAVALQAAAQRGLARASVPVVLTPTEPQPGDFQLRLQLQVQELQEEKVAPEKAKDAAPAQPKRVLRAVCAGLLSARLHHLADSIEPGEPGGDKPPTGPQLPELTKLEHVGMTQKPLAPGQPTPAPAEVLGLVERLIEDSAFTLGSQLHLISTDSRALLALVSKGEADPELRQTAIQLLGQRKERLALPVLIALIKERDPGSEPGEARAVRKGLRDAAIGALVEIGDQSAVRPLLDSVPFRDYTEMGKVLEAVAALGGDEARRYLQFVKSSHPEPAIRDEAAAALTHLESHSKPPPKSPDPQ